MNCIIYGKYTGDNLCSHFAQVAGRAAFFIFTAFFFHQENLDLVVAKGSGKRRTVLRSGSVVRKRDPVTGGEV